MFKQLSMGGDFSPDAAKIERNLAEFVSAQPDIFAPAASVAPKNPPAAPQKEQKTPGFLEDAMSVSELNSAAKSLLEGHLSNVYVEGEVSKMSAPGSYKHWYFTLKDEKECLDCTFFNPPANLPAPQVGEKVVLLGKLSIYGKTGRYQFIASKLFATSERGRLHEQYLQLYEKLQNAGVFERKRPMPPSFKSVGIITSASSAAAADMLRIRQELGDFCTRVSIYDSAVQGQMAPAQLLNALARADAAGHDVLLLARGGGSKEDLFCFNDEALALAISQAKTLVITAIGHEVDQHLADFAADLSLPTPTAAARRVFFDALEREQQIDGFVAAVKSSIASGLERRKAALQVKKLTLAKNPFKQYLSKLEGYEKLLQTAARGGIKARQNALKSKDAQTALRAAVSAKTADFERKKIYVSDKNLRQKISAMTAAQKASEQRLRAALAAKMSEKTAALARAKSVLQTSEGFLKTMRKSFVVKNSAGAALDGLSGLKSGEEISIENLLNAGDKIRARVL